MARASSNRIDDSPSTCSACSEPAKSTSNNEAERMQDEEEGECDDDDDDDCL